MILAVLTRGTYCKLHFRASVSGGGHTRIKVRGNSAVHIKIISCSIFPREHIRYKPTSPCKLCKLQSGPSDQHLRGGAQGGRRGICKSVITQSKSWRLIVKLSNPPCSLDVDPVTQIEILHGDVNLHMIYSLFSNALKT